MKKVFAIQNQTVAALAVVFIFAFFFGVALADNGNSSAYEGTISGEWSGDIQGHFVSGTFLMKIAADGTVSGSVDASGSILGSEPAAIKGKVNPDGNIRAKSFALSEWSWEGKITKVGGRLEGGGLIKGSGISGTWSSK